jgi:hypothetical protein
LYDKKKANKLLYNFFKVKDKKALKIYEDVKKYKN